MIALAQRRGKALNDSRAPAPRARALRAAAQRGLRAAARRDAGALAGARRTTRGAACAGAALLRPDGTPQACAWRFPTPLTALAGALFLHRLFTVQSKGARTREVDWCQSSALLVRREAAEQVGYLDGDFFVYSDEVDFARRLRDAGWRSLYVPGASRRAPRAARRPARCPSGGSSSCRATAICTCESTTRRAAARAVRWLTAWTYALRALAALVLPGHSPRRYWRHVTATLRPERGEGLREAADAYNATLGRLTRSARSYRSRSGSSA